MKLIFITIVLFIIGGLLFLPDISQSDDLAQSFLKNGREEEDRGNMAEALKHYETAYDVDPLDQEVNESVQRTKEKIKLAEEWYFKGMKFRREGNESEAVKAFDKTLGYWPNHPGAKEEKGQSEEERELFERHMKNGKKYEEERKLDEAIEQYKYAEDIDPRNEMVAESIQRIERNKQIAEKYFEEGQKLRDAKNEDDARLKFEEVLMHWPNHSKAVHMLSSMGMNSDEEVKFLQELLIKGREFENQRNLEEALVQYELALEVDANSQLADKGSRRVELLKKGLEFENQNNLKEALEQYESVLKVDTNSQLAKEDVRRVKEQLDIQVEPDEPIETASPSELLKKGLEFENQNNLKEALEQYESALKVDTNSQLAKEGVRRVKEQLETSVEPDEPIETASPSEMPPQPAGLMYIVKKGDKLSKIASEYYELEKYSSCIMNAIKNINENIENINNLEVDWEIRLPSGERLSVLCPGEL